MVHRHADVTTLCAVLIALLAFGLPLNAQENAGSLPLRYGESVSGTLNARAPRAVYAFEGLRGDIVTLNVQITRGNLDPILTLIDAGGQVIALRDDATFGLDAPGGPRDIRLQSLRLPTNDTYYLILGRFGMGLGTTEGDYTLTLERLGASADSGSALRYGDSVINTISDMTPQIYYTFRARRGDIVTIRMQRMTGNLDSSLQLVNSSSFVIAENDDVPGTGSLDAEIRGLVIPEDGVYVIIASRFGQAAGRSAGTFVLTLESAAQSGLGASPRAPITIAYGDTVQGELTAERYEQFYEFQGERDDTITIRMARSGGALDTYLSLLDSRGVEIAANDDSEGSQNSLISQFVLPASGRYTIVATRYQRAQGQTVGRYTLSLEYEGNIFTGVLPNTPRLQYGSTVAGVITDEAPQVLYAFQGRAGENISISMNRVDGNLDPRVAILDAELRELVADDDSGGSQNARIDRFTLPYTGVYYVQASRYAGDGFGLPTSGGYLLVLVQRTD